MESKEITDQSFNVPPPEYTQYIKQLESNAPPYENNQPNATGQATVCQSQPLAILTVPASQSTSNNVILGPYPARMQCPHCRNEIVTQTTTKWSCCQHCVCCCMLITGICTLCSCLPYCMTSYSHMRHQCPICRAHLGTFLR